MTQLALSNIDFRAGSAVRPAPRASLFVAAALALVALSALLAGFVPLGFSIVTVFLFAGPHNWLEFRYFLSRMPAHWGPMRAFFVTGTGGVLGLTAAFIIIPILGRRLDWSGQAWTNAAAMWDSAVVLWIAGLVVLRAREKRRNRNTKATEAGHENTRSGREVERSQGSMALPIAFLLVAGVWLLPAAWDLGLVYLHPLVVLWFLDREIGRRRPGWRGAYRLSLLAVPAALAVLWWRLADAPPLAGNDMITMRITRHARGGTELLPSISTHALVATHTFLEMLHYGVWVLAIPLLAMRTAPWKLESVPLFRRSAGWKLAVGGLAVAGVLVVIGLWAAFLTNYPLTRDIYFTVAMAHVLAEAPFLLRTL